MDWGNVFSQALTQGIGIQAVIFALAAIGLNVHFGYTGLLNFGQAGFLAVAAYGLGVSGRHCGLAPVGGRARGHPGGGRCWRCCSASRRCACARTIWPS